MNKLTITRNGTTVSIEQDEPISADIIAETIKALDSTNAAPTPVSPPPIPWRPINPSGPWTIPGTGTTPWTVGPSIFYCNPEVSYGIAVTAEHLEEQRKKGLLSYTTDN